MAKKRKVPLQRFWIMPHRGEGPLPKGKQLKELQRFLHQTGFLHLVNHPPAPGASPPSKLPRARLGESPAPTAKALRHFQLVNALPDTAALDDETVRLLSFPRCGVATRQVNGVLAASAGNPWAGPKLTYSFAEYSGVLPKDDVEAAFEEAFGVWSEVTPLKFSQVKNGGDIQIRFIPRTDSDYSSAGGMAGAVFGSGVNYLAWTDVGAPGGRSHFNDVENWKLENPPSQGVSNGIDLISVAIHELGHALGLNHSPDRAAVMYEYHFGPHRFLNDDDKQKIQALYPG
jgi:hypothetical protein